MAFATVVCSRFARGAVCTFVPFTLSLVHVQEDRCGLFGAVLWAGGRSWRGPAVVAVGLRTGPWCGRRCLAQVAQAESL